MSATGPRIPTALWMPVRNSISWPALKRSYPDAPIDSSTCPNAPIAVITRIPARTSEARPPSGGVHRRPTETNSAIERNPRTRCPVAWVLASPSATANANVREIAASTSQAIARPMTPRFARRPLRVSSPLGDPMAAHPILPICRAGIVGGSRREGAR